MSAPRPPSDSITASVAEQGAPQPTEQGREPAVALPAPAFSRLERVSVACLNLVQAGVFAWSYVLPWDKASLFVVLSCALTVVHLLTALCFLVPRAGDRWRRRAWAASSLGALLFLAWATWAVATSGVYLSRLYGGLGQGMSAVLVAIWGLIALLTLPTALWGLGRTREVWRGARRTLGLLSSALALSTIGVIAGLAQCQGARAEPVVMRDAATDARTWEHLVSTMVAPVVAQRNAERAGPSDDGEPSTLNHRAVIACGEPALGKQPTAVAHYVDRDGKPRTTCTRAGTLEELAAQLAETLSARAGRGAVAIDRLTETRSLAAPGWLSALSLRPGIDGVCLTGRCYAPWQLVAQSRFVTHSPLPFLADLKFGASLAELARALRDKAPRNAQTEPGEASLLAWSSQSTAVDHAGVVTPLVRMHPIDGDVTPERVFTASAAFEKHILDAQLPNGQFRYTLDPFTGKAETRELNLARQAGTLFALCDVGSSSAAVTDAARRGLQLLLEHRLERDDTWALALTKKARTVRLGDSALPLVALLTCRKRVGDEFDVAITHLARFVVGLQRKDGSFATDYDWRRQKPITSRAEALYAPGQALLALTLLEMLVAEESHLVHLADPTQLAAAIQNGMRHVAEEHWDVPVRPFFFVEENWNCLTAKAALRRQRNEAYERFCLDYVAFKSRLIFGPDSGVAPEFIGGFGFGNVIPPHNTGAAGFGEALAAAAHVARARGATYPTHTSVIRDLVAFLLRQQWTRQSCPACTPGALGSLSEHMHSPITRIDFAQHAWAAVAHGAAVLGVTGPAS